MLGGSNRDQSRSGVNNSNRGNNSSNNTSSNNTAGSRGGNNTNSSSNNGQRPAIGSKNSEGGSAASSMFSNSQADAPSSLGGATSVSGGIGSPGKDRSAGFGIRVDDIGQGDGDDGGAATLGSIANEMIDNRGQSQQHSGASARPRNDTLYEDAREDQRGNQQSQGRGKESTTANTNTNSGHSSGGRNHGSVTPTPGSADQSRSSPHHKDGREGDTAHLSKGKSGQKERRQQQHSHETQGKSQNQPQQSTQETDRSTDHRASIATTDSRLGAGYGNASHFEQTDAASFIGQDPIALATDFNRDDADTVFLSTEMGSGANRQPMTRFRIHSVNLNAHSPVLSEMVDDLPEDESDLQLEEDSATLKLLFGLMYNSSAPSLGMNEWQVVLRLARCAQKYDFARAKEVAAAYFTEQEQLGALSPFMTYAFAVQYKLPALEEAAAERSVRYDIHRLPELVFNMMGFAAFQQLASFHTRRQSHYQDILNNISIDPKELSDQCYQTGGVCVIAPWNRLKQKLAWPRQAGRDGSKRPPEPADVIRKLVTEIGQIDCGTCSRALVEAALQAQLALESMPSYVDKEEAF